MLCSFPSTGLLPPWLGLFLGTLFFLLLWKNNFKTWYIYTMEHYAAERNKELLSSTTAWVELEGIMLSEISQVVKDKYHMDSPLSGT